ncbi:velvet factor, partial [Mariannaea sp. PMI_226]
EYKLRLRQQPVAARSCGFGERDRRVIDPPPIVQLLVESPNLSEDEIKKRLRYSHYVMSCSIYHESGTRDAAYMPEEYRQQRRLMGSLVGAPFVGKDEFGEEGCFFCFPDLSCRTPGAFRLKFSLVMIDPVRAKDVRHFPVLVEIMTDVFHVYSAKDFPGMQASTALTKRLKEQGCIISIKKGANEKGKNSRVYEDSSDDDDE